ncbi:hypothetical protein [Denitratisoma oestradiolicum]|uniref:6-bladed beta-propeller n=1 Tax=Denitratisoma oestradiolicum TaxID=311182 RepID=A0A6S6XXY0_9PROT|nr:hypothetical protein [Denitratisoma oestradiolicum]TWO80637.1 6-bladed beta-propeller [Denitratisoma oestradiolicum]CAB1367719.1 conserved exported protein of unknown function [Denitratisoma oestradiolicum]
MKSLLVLLVLLLVGCAGTTEKAVLRINLDEAPQTVPRMFPPQSNDDIPRYIYAGQLLGESNFVYPERHDSALVSALRWLVGLGQADDEPNVLQRPLAGVVDDSGRILVTDVSRQAVLVFDPGKGELMAWDKAVGMQSFVSPVGIALGRDGVVYVADAELGLIARLDREGRSLGALGKGMLQRPTGLVYDLVRHRLYVADTYAHHIKIFEEDGSLVGEIGERGDHPLEFNYPTYLALHNDALYVSDTMNARVQVISLATGDYIRSIGQRGMSVGDLVRPKGVAVDNEGNVYIVESYWDHLLVFNQKGDFLMPIGGGAGQQVGQYYLPSGVWVDARNRVFLSDTFNGRVAVFQYLGGGGEHE